MDIVITIVAESPAVAIAALAGAAVAFLATGSWIMGKVRRSGNKTQVTMTRKK